MTVAELAIRQRIRQRGQITFAEFMRLALYHPVDGYYSSESPFGAAGDYYTSPAVHPAFGALLSVQLFVMWQRMSKPHDFTVVEMGSGNGLLASDICGYAEMLSDTFAASLRYVCIERYATKKGHTASDAAIVSCESLLADQLPLRGVVGCIISNELLDALPVHRFQFVDGDLLETYVSLNDDQFVEVLDTPSSPNLAERLSQLGFSLSDGHRGEICLEIGPWIDDVAQALAEGFVVTLDYGYTAEELYSSRRSNGTIQTYYRHTEGSSPFRRIGRQDITAHVDFSLLQSEGESQGLNTIEYTRQADYLHGLGYRGMLQRLRDSPLGNHELNANLLALQELVNPEGLGAFKVLIQEKGTDVSSGSQLLPPESVQAWLKAPLLSDRHMPLMEGRYPHTSWEAPTLWGEWGNAVC